MDNWITSHGLTDRLLPATQALRWQLLIFRLVFFVQITLGSTTRTMSTQQTLRIWQTTSSRSCRVCHRFTLPVHIATATWSPATFSTPAWDTTCPSPLHRWDLPHIAFCKTREWWSPLLHEKSSQHISSESLCGAISKIKVLKRVLWSDALELLAL